GGGRHGERVQPGHRRSRRGHGRPGCGPLLPGAAEGAGRERGLLPGLRRVPPQRRGPSPGGPGLRPRLSAGSGLSPVRRNGYHRRVADEEVPNMTESYKLVIGGGLTDAASGETFDSIDPSTGQPFAKVAKAGADDARKAAEAARKAFDEGPWPKLKGRERAAALLKVADAVKQNAGALAELEARDAGHTIRMAKGADIGMVISTFRVFAEIAAREGDEVPLARNPGSMNYLRYEPVGVCVGISPWNFPIQLAAWKLAPATAAGNRAGNERASQA